MVTHLTNILSYYSDSFLLLKTWGMFLRFSSPTLPSSIVLLCTDFEISVVILLVPLLSTFLSVASWLISLILTVGYLLP